MPNPVSGYDKCYRAIYPWLGMSVAYQVSLDAARVYEAIRNGDAYVEDISVDTNIPVGELSIFLQELIAAKAIYEDSNYSPNGFGTPLGMDLSIGKLYEEDSTVRRSRDHRPMPTNLMNIMSDQNLAAIVIPDYVVPQASQSSPTSQPTQEEMAAFMQLMTMQQQQKGGNGR